jgi:5-methylcytosine-specific restriction protein A
MPNITAAAGADLNASYLIEEFQGVSGLILESWGPSARNADYNEALEVIIERLQSMSVGEIGVNVISRDLVERIPSFADRAILLDSTTSVSLRGRGSRVIRLEIGRAQASLKVDPSKPGGNRTKRILLHSTQLTPSDWHLVASSSVAPAATRIPVIPTGNPSPNSFAQMTVVIERDPGVRTWILRAAEGFCELCRQPAPFLDAEGVPFLEVHHVIPLATGGPDTITNAVALCPNCHRELHHGKERNFKIQCLYDQIHRLTKAAS